MNKKLPSGHCSSEDSGLADFVAQDDAFLDSVADMLQYLAAECSSALEWSSSSERIVADAAEAFESLVGICRQAGLTIADVKDEQLDLVMDSPISPDPSLMIEVPISCLSCSGASCLDPGSTRSYAPANSEASSPRLCDSLPNFPEPDAQGYGQQHLPSSVRREDIIEIELTDLLTHTHEEIEHCRRELTEQLHQADRRHSEAQTQSQTDLQVVRSALGSSQETMNYVQQELHETKQSMATLLSSVLQSQKAMEAAMKDQTRQWKAICNDLIVEKRNVAQKLAEERGKCAAMKEHLTMHDNQRHARESQPIPLCTRNGHNRARSPSPGSLSELEPEDNPTAAPVCSTSSLPCEAIDLSGSSEFDLLYVNPCSKGTTAFSSALRPPSSPSLSRAVSPSAIHSQRRNLKSSDLSISPTSNSGHQNRSFVITNSKSDSSPSGVKVRLEPLSGRTSGATASFRRYYLSSQQLSSTTSSSRNSSNAASSSSRPPPSADAQ